ncbi:hypothetical protein DK389_09780 [Methylobacterium durans]|uniref:Uncharacterized protein n=1 Tax=Methylobacterium durans TaxID=2202825 RepID=A0A2U8W3S8_9HYPH|nr:hypothetical protein DK389_09780 [Methylobacterium durans]
MRTLMARELWEAAQTLGQEGSSAAAAIRQSAYRMWLELTLKALSRNMDQQGSGSRRRRRVASVAAGSRPEE